MTQVPEAEFAYNALPDDVRDHLSKLDSNLIQALLTPSIQSTPDSSNPELYFWDVECDPPYEKCIELDPLLLDSVIDLSEFFEILESDSTSDTSLPPEERT